MDRTIFKIKYSIIIPIKNEEDNIFTLIGEIEEVMTALKEPWELICIDDGSTDQTLHILKSLKKEKPYLRLVVFDKNYGQTSAFDAGFKKAKGEIIITMDGDRQNDPNDIPKLVDALSDCDMSCGWRSNRKDSWSKKITSKVANFIRSILLNDHMQDASCSLKAFEAEKIKQIKIYHGMHRFLPILFKIEGFTVKQIPVNHRERLKGTSKYSIFNRFLGPITDMLVVYWMSKRRLKYHIKEEL